MKGKPHTHIGEEREREREREREERERERELHHPACLLDLRPDNESINTFPQFGARERKEVGGEEKATTVTALAASCWK